MSAVCFWLGVINGLHKIGYLCVQTKVWAVNSNTMVIVVDVPAVKLTVPGNLQLTSNYTTYDTEAITVLLIMLFTVTVACAETSVVCVPAICVFKFDPSNSYFAKIRVGLADEIEYYNTGLQAVEL